VSELKKESILFGLIGLVIGALGMMALAANAVNSQNTGMMKMMGMGVERMGNKNSEQGMGMSSSMDDMMGSMDNISGYEFDKAFLNAMIVHHEGAIKMAEQAEHQAQHQEIKDLSKNIISAQTSEIEQMKQWKKNWMME
jgi:uncharacterized protein (DUF305 family)